MTRVRVSIVPGGVCVCETTGVEHTPCASGESRVPGRGSKRFMVMGSEMSCHRVPVGVL